MRKEDKGNIIAQLGEVLNEYAHFYLVDVTGLNLSLIHISEPTRPY